MKGNENQIKFLNLANNFAFCSNVAECVNKLKNYEKLVCLWIEF